MESADAWHMTGDLGAEHGKGDPFAAAVRATRMPIIVTNPRQDDNPIVFANDAFLRATGYDRDEVMGRNCRFLQGPDTDRAAVAEVRDAIEAGRDINIDLLNYRKDGTTFWNALYVSPVTTGAGELQYFFASQLDITERKEAIDAKTMLLHEVDHRVKNNLQMISALISIQANSVPDPAIRATLNTMLGRVEALSTVHRRLYQSDDVSRFDVAAFANDIVTDLVGASGRCDIDLELDLEPVQVPAEKAAPLALMVNELVTNTLKHAFAGERPGTIRVAVKRQDPDRYRISVEDDGAGMREDEAPRPASFGRNLVRTLGRQLRATTTWSAGEPSGTRVEIDLPVDQPQRG